MRAVAGTGLAFFEQPVARHDLAGMAAVAAASRVPIGADEGIHSLDDIERHHAAKAARGVSLKAIKLGGMRARDGGRQLCDRLGMKVNVSCKTGESSIASAAACTSPLSCRTRLGPDRDQSRALPRMSSTDPLASSTATWTVLDRPGLGIEVDERRVRRWQQEFTATKCGVSRFTGRNVPKCGRTS